LSDRVIEITDDGLLDHQYNYTEFLERRIAKQGELVGA